MSGKGRIDKFHSWRGNLAYRLWVQEQAPVNLVCRICRINQRSLSVWRAKYGWDEQRKNHARGFADVVGALRGTLSRLSSEMDALASAPRPDRSQAADGEPDRRLDEIGRVSRTMHQLMSTMEQILKVQDQHGPSAYALKTSEDLIDFVKARDPGALAVLRPLIRSYLQERVLGRPEQP